MSNEKKLLFSKVAVILESICSKYKYSDAMVEIEPDGQYFNDACNFVGLHHEIMEFKRTLQNMVKYSEMTE